MGYIKAENVLPDEIIELIQNYIDGEYLYIPRKKGNEKVGEKLMELKKILIKEIEKSILNIALA